MRRSCGCMGGGPFGDTLVDIVPGAYRAPKKRSRDREWLFLEVAQQERVLVC